MAAQKISAVLFDFDMTLADTSYGIHYCTVELARHFGLRLVTREEVMKIIGLSIEDGWRLLWGDFKDEWITYYRENFRGEEMSRTRLFPHTKNVLEDLKKRGVHVGVSSNRRYAERPLKVLGLDGYMDVVVGLDKAKNPKPAPDVVLTALDVLGVKPENALYVGDTNIDMQTAVNAEARGIGMTTGNFDRAGLKKAGAWKTFDDLDGIPGLVGDI